MAHVLYHFRVIEPNFGVAKSIKGHLRSLNGSSTSLEMAREGWEVAGKGGRYELEICHWNSVQIYGFQNK